MRVPFQKQKGADEGAPLLVPDCKFIAKRKAKVGRGDWIRTSDLSVPNRALYQAEPRPEEPLV
jgi:hypothetical protein